MPIERTDRVATGADPGGTVIGIAVGILMCRLRVTEDGAFAVLCTHSQDHNVKVRDLAEEVV
jgi:AmiR/NasT family two-component response regulator